MPTIWRSVAIRILKWRLKWAGCASARFESCKDVNLDWNVKLTLFGKHLCLFISMNKKGNCEPLNVRYIFGSCLFLIGLRRIVTDVRTVFYIKRRCALYFLSKNTLRLTSFFSYQNLHSIHKVHGVLSWKTKFQTYSQDYEVRAFLIIHVIIGGQKHTTVICDLSLSLNDTYTSRTLCIGRRGVAR